MRAPTEAAAGKARRTLRLLTVAVADAVRVTPDTHWAKNPLDWSDYKERGELDREDQVWDLHGKSPARRLSDFRPGQIWDRLTFSPDRKLAIFRTFHFAEVQDWIQDKSVVNLDGEANCNSVAVTPDGKTLLMGHGDGKVGLWELPTGKKLGSFQIQLPRLNPPEGVYLAVSSDSQMLAAAHRSTITLWKLDSILPRK